MGCGASSGAQISPINGECPMELKNGASLNCSRPNPGKGARPTSQDGRSQSRQNFGFNLGLLFPCRFIGNDSPLLPNSEIGYKQFFSSEVQTENDILGFKCQPSQTDSQILTDEELEAMIELLEEEIMKIQKECLINRRNTDNDNHGDSGVDDDDDDVTDELIISQRTWKNIIKAHKDNMENEKKYANIAIQATLPKSTCATQTKFGSIDHQFVPKNNMIFPKSSQNSLLQNDLLTKTISENLRKVIEEPSSLSNSFDQHLSNLFSSLEDDGDCCSEQLANGDHEEMVDSLQRTLSVYNCICDVKPRESTLRFSSDEMMSPETTPNPNEKPIPSVERVNSRKNLLQRKFLKQQKFQDCLQLIIEDIRSKKNIDQLLPPQVEPVQKRDVSLQTTNDILTDEAPEYAARAPICHKNEMIPSLLMFRDIDRKMIEAPEFGTVQEICNYINKNAKNDLFKVRAMFIWITKNIKYSFNEHDKNMISSEILQKKEGVSRHYTQLFGDLCRVTGIRVKLIEGFVRNYDYRPGSHFKIGRDSIEYWNAVFVLSTWRFIDLTLAAGYTDNTGQFQQELNEHFFMTDPSVMVWTHFPHSQLENNYERWQLLDKPIRLEEFNSFPKVNENFFEYNLSIRSRIHNPLEFRISTEIKIGSHEAMRYKYKLYPAEEVENSSLNHYVFCQLKEDRLVGSFMISPPFEGRFLLKIFAKPEREMYGSQQDLTASLNPVSTILLHCTKARKYIEPYPINELPWGPTQRFYDYKLKLINQKGPIIVTWGGRRRLVLDANETMLISYSLFDSESMEMDARSIIFREDTGLKTTFTINPPRVGTFKFMLFGMPKPKQKGKWRLPMLATFMIDCKLIKPPQHDEDMVHVANNLPDDNKTDKKNKK